MNIRQLTYFTAIVDNGSFSKAARALRIAQPALSQHIVNLEEELGTALLVRTHRGVTATQAGEVLYLHATKIAAQLKQAADDVHFEANHPKGEVVIVYPPMLGEHIAPRLFQRVSDQYPEIQLRILEELSLECNNLVETGRADLGLVASDTPLKNIKSIPLYEEWLYAVARLNEDEQPRSDYSDITFGDLCRKELVLSQKRHAVRQILEDQALSSDLSLTIKVQTEASKLRRAYIRHGIGTAVLPWASLYPMWDRGEISASKIVKPELSRIVYFAWPRNYPLNAAAKVVKDITIDIIDELFANDVIRGRRIPIDPEQE